MISSAIDFSIVLQEVVSFYYPPPSRVIVRSIFELFVGPTSFSGVGPSEESSIPTHRIDLGAVSVLLSMTPTLHNIIPALDLEKTMRLEQFLGGQPELWE